MIDQKENIDELFRDELKNYAPSPPGEAWGRIEKDLAKGRKKVIIPVFLKVAASILIITSISWIVWKSFISTPQEQSLSVLNENENVTTEKPVSSPILSDNNNKSYIAKISTPILSEKDPSAPVETIFPETKQELADIIEKSKAVQPIPEINHADNTISPMDSRTLFVYSDREDQIYPVIEPSYKEVNANEIIIQQNLLALESQMDIDQKRGPEWSVGGQAGPQYTYRDVYVNAPSYPIDNYDEYESGLLAYSGGLQFEVEPVKRFSIQSGIYYSKIGQIKSSTNSFLRSPMMILPAPAALALFFAAVKSCPWPTSAR